MLCFDIPPSKNERCNKNLDPLWSASASKYVSLATSPNTQLILFLFPFHESCIHSAHFDIFVDGLNIQKASSNDTDVLMIQCKGDKSKLREQQQSVSLHPPPRAGDSKYNPREGPSVRVKQDELLLSARTHLAGMDCVNLNEANAGDDFVSSSLPPAITNPWKVLPGDGCPGSDTPCMDTGL